MIASVALGVAVVVAVDLANQSATRAFQLSTDAVVGKATHQIVGGARGLDDSVYRDLRLVHGMRQSAPVVDGLRPRNRGRNAGKSTDLARRPRHRTRCWHILGVDLFARGSVPHLFQHRCERVARGPGGVPCPTGYDSHRGRIRPTT